MNSRTKVLIANKDGARLISLLLWLEQYADLEVTGTTSSDDELKQYVIEHKPDVVLLDLNVQINGNCPASFIKSKDSSPSVLLMHQSEIKPLEGPLTRDCDGQINPKNTLKDIVEIIRKAANKRMVQITATRIPSTKAG